ncbi:DUF4190 domain-containing protein [Brevibacterium casei]|uniref:DUF4190 domain-containing protein n=1 Tax=Brevibacterium casei TaxID=33889 RepID=UPI0011A95243|nr:DUF4190 domain-containing protein [Brevibacterium casei]MDH5147761.1 DUF4190 domain-containing protein [Brevibacterium casei]
MSSQNNWNNPDMYYQQPQSRQPAGSYSSNSYQAANYNAASSYGNAGVAYQALPPNNTLAIIALVASIFGVVSSFFIAGIAGIVMGHIARKQIRERGERGDGMAVAALWVGYIGTALWILAWLFIILAYLGMFALVFFGSSSSYS